MRWERWASLLLVVSALGGCIGGGSGADELSVEPAAENGTSTANGTTFAFNSTTIEGSAALEVRLTLPGETECTFELWTAHEDATNGPLSLMTIETDGFTSWLSSSTAEHAHAHGAGVDTRNTTSSSGNTASYGWLRGTFEGEVRATLVGTDLGSWENDLTEDVSFGLRVNCEDPLRVDGLAGGGQAWLEDARSLSGGVGAHASGLFLEAEASANDGMVRELDAERVRLMADAFEINGEDRTEIDVEGPNDTATWQVGSPLGRSFHSLQGGPGEYSLDLRRTAAGSAVAFWTALFGVEPIEEPQAVETLAAGSGGEPGHPGSQP